MFEHIKLFLPYEQPQRFHQTSNHCLTAIIWMSLKHFKQSFCQMSKKGRQNIWLWSNMRPFLHRGGGVFSSLCYRRQVTEWRKGKDKKMFQLQEAHLLAHPVSLQLNYLSCEMNFPTEKTGRHRPTCSGKILHKHFFSAQEKQSGLRNKSPSLRVKRALYDTTPECNKLIFGKAVWQRGNSTAHSHLDTLLSGKTV